MNARRILARSALVLSIVLGGCLPVDDAGRTSGIGIENRSAETVDIEYIGPDGARHIVVGDLLALAGTAKLDPSSRVGECNVGTLRAIAASGEVIAETTERLCDGDVWIIPDEAAPS